jgi:hypothetical protein
MAILKDEIIISYLATYNRVPLYDEYLLYKNNEQISTMKDLVWHLSQTPEANSVGSAFPTPSTYTAEFAAGLRAGYDGTYGNGVWGFTDLSWKGQVIDCSWDLGSSVFSDEDVAKILFAAMYIVSVWRNMFGNNDTVKAELTTDDIHVAFTVLYLFVVKEQKPQYMNWQTDYTVWANIPKDLTTALYAENSLGRWEDNVFLNAAFREFEASGTHIDKINKTKAYITNVTEIGNTIIGLGEVSNSDSNAVYSSTSLSGEWQVGSKIYNVTLDDAYGAVVDLDDTSDSLSILLEKFAIEDVNYGAEYIAAYNILVDKAINSTRAPFKILSDMIDNTPSNELSSKEKLSIKKNALMNLLTSVTSSAQSSAMQLVDKKYKFKDELISSSSQAIKSQYDAMMVMAQKKALEEQVVDNRRIRAMDALSDTYGTMMAGGLIPNEQMWQEYFRIHKELSRNSLESDKLKNFVGTWTPASYVDGTYVAEVYTDNGDGTYTLTTPASGTLVDGYRYQEPCSTVGVDISVTVNNDGVTPAKGGSIRNGKGEYIANVLRTDDLKRPGNFWFVDLSHWHMANPSGYKESGETPTDMPNRLCSISLDGINYWKHGDIVYVAEIIDPVASNDEPTVLYKRMSGYSAGSSVTVAPSKIEETNSTAVV